MPVFTFLENNDFSGKIVVPFCTHEGSGFGRSEADLKKALPYSEVKNGLAIKGTTVKNAENEVRNWVQKVVR